MPSFAFMALAAVPLLSRYAYAQCAPVDSIKLTVYGYADGPGDTTSFGCSGSTPFQSTPQTPGVAGGSGTYDDPFTLATVAGSSLLSECELVYIPYLKKYYRYQDHCSGCDSNHVDLWVGTDTNGGATQITCEEDIGTSVQTIVKNPPNGLDVDQQNLWDGSCHTDAVFSNPDTSNVCSGGSSGPNSSPSSSSAAAPPPPASTATPYSAPAQPQPTTPRVPAPQQPTTPPVPAPQQPSSSFSYVAAPAFTGWPGHGTPPQVKAEVKQSVVPTTLKTIASAPVSSDEPTGTPLATSNGVCTTAGAAVCSTDGTQIGICNIDMTVIFMDVAPGTKCVDGGMVFANS